MSFSINSPSQGVGSLNDLTGALSLVAGTNITLTPSGTNITIDAVGGGGLPSAFAATNSLSTELEGTVPALTMSPAFDPTATNTLFIGSQDSDSTTVPTSSLALATGAIINSAYNSVGNTGFLTIATGDSESTTVPTSNQACGQIQIQAGSANQGYSGNISITGGSTLKADTALLGICGNVNIQAGTISTDGSTVTGSGIVSLIGPVQLSDSAQHNAGISQPTAANSWQGMLWFKTGGAGTADTLQMCMMSASGTYSWVTIATG